MTIAQISSADSPVGFDAVYVHAVILDKLAHIMARLEALEQTMDKAVQSAKKN